MNRNVFAVWGIVLALCLGRGASAQYGQIGNSNSTVRAINDARDVVGTENGRAALWTWAGSTISLPLYDNGYPKGSANSINNFGDIVGSVSNGFGANKQKACLWKKINGGYSSALLIDEISGSPFLSSQALAINDVGWMAGSASVSSTVTHAFVSVPGQGSVDITQTATEAYAVSINNRNTVVGCYRTGSSTNYTPFLWTPNGGLNDLPRGNFVSGRANQINDVGVIAGTVTTGGGETLACIWRPDHTLQVNNGYAGNAHALAINQEGWIGGDDGSGTHPLLVWFDVTTNQFSVQQPVPAAPFADTLVSSIIALSSRSWFNPQTGEWEGVALCVLPDGTNGRFPFIPRRASRAIGTITLRSTPLNPSVIGGASVPAAIQMQDATGSPLTVLGDTVIRLSASLTGAVSIPDTISILSESSSAEFTIQTLPAGMGYDLDIQAIPPVGTDAGALTDRTVTLRITYPLTTITGNVTLQGCTNNAQPITFEFRNTTGQKFPRMVTTGTTGSFSFADIPQGTYSVWAKGSKWLANAVTVFATTSAGASGVNLPLRGGDANGNNVVDIIDLNLLVAHYNQHSPNPGYLASADFNNDGVNDITDLLLLISNYNQSGVP